MTKITISEEKLVSVVRQAVREEMAALQPVKDPEAMQTGNEVGRNLHSMVELAKFMGCSVTCAQNMKNAGRIPYRQVGRKVIFNTVEILKAIEPARRDARRASVKNNH